jgi:RNA recognition motif-containing protein
MRLLVNNLASDVTDASLLELFAPFGAVTSTSVLTDADGKPSGGAYVEMTGDSEGRAAIRGLHGRAVGERSLTVNLVIFKPRDDRPNRGFRKQPGRSGGRRY